MKRREQARAGLGAASMVLILLVLCLALLGVLSLMTAENDLKMSEREAQLSAAYAEAAASAQRALMELDVQMSKAYRASGNEAQYATDCAKITQAGEAQVVWLDDASAVMAFDAGADREIEVEIKRCAWEEAGTKRFIIVRHTLMDTHNWEQTEGLTLMGI